MVSVHEAAVDIFTAISLPFIFLPDVNHILARLSSLLLLCYY